MTSELMALELHRKMGLPIAKSLDDIAYPRLVVRLRLVAEEVAELFAAMLGWVEEDEDVVRATIVGAVMTWLEHGVHCEPDLAAIAKEMADVHAVVSGTAVEYGIAEDAVSEEVHRSNMAKTNRPNSGKLVKPEGWQPPNVASVLGL